LFILGFSSIMALVAKAFSDLLRLDITLTAGQATAGKPIPELDLDSLHKYSLHYTGSPLMDLWSVHHKLSLG